MNSINSSLLCLVLVPLLAMPWAIEAFDITKMLAQYPEFGTFNQYLTETKLADQINGRQTITVLALDNSAVSTVSGKPLNTIKAILSTHVILDYFDEQKLMSTLASQQNQLTTLYQTTGVADKLQGFIKVGLIGEGEIAFGSAVNGAPFNANLVKTVTTQPYNISILQVSQAIVAPGIGAQSPPSASASPSQSSPPVPAPKAKAPVASRKIISPVQSPAASGSPDDVEAPSPAESLDDEEAPSPATHGPDASDTAPEPSSSSSRIQMGFVWATVMGLGALLVAL